MKKGVAVSLSLVGVVLIGMAAVPGVRAELAEGAIVQIEGDLTIYEIRGGERWAITDEGTFAARRHNWNSVQVIDSAVASLYPHTVTFIPEGGLIKTANNPDVWIIKYVGGKQFRRLILHPGVFASYAHLRWEDVRVFPANVVNSFTESKIVRLAGSNQYWLLIQSGDSGTRSIRTESELASLGHDVEAAYEINATDHGSYSDSTTPDVPEEPVDTGPGQVVSGKVKERLADYSYGNLIPGATVTFTHQIDGTVVTTTSDSVGEYETFLAPGKWYILVEEPNYQSYVSNPGVSVIYDSDAVHTANFWLTVMDGLVCPESGRFPGTYAGDVELLEEKPPEVTLTIEPAIAKQGDMILVTAVATDDTGLTAVWPIGPSNAGEELHKAFWQDCAGAMTCTKEVTFLAPGPGVYMFTAQARDVLYGEPGPHQANGLACATLTVTE